MSTKQSNHGKKARLASTVVDIQQKAFNRGVEHGIAVALISLGKTSGTILEEHVLEVRQKKITVSKLDPSQGKGHSVEIV